MLHPVGDAAFPAHTPHPPGGSPLPSDVDCRQVVLTRPWPEHRHDSYLVTFAVGGSGQHSDAGGCLPIFAGDVCVMRPGAQHAYPRVHGSLTLVKLSFSATYLAQCAPLLGDTSWILGDERCAPATHVRLSALELNRLKGLLAALADELAAADSAPGVRAGLLLQILGSIEREWRAAVDLGEETDVTDDRGLPAAIRYLHHRYMGPLTIEELAEQTGYSAAHLTRKFRRYLGTSPSEYLLNLRMRRACSLLQDTALPITAVASDAGFHDSQYFATRFHQLMGMTPSQFRAQARAHARSG